MPRHRIDLRNEAPKRYKLSDGKIRKAASSVLTALGWKKAALSLWIVGDRKMRSLNKKFLRHDYATDVISFSQIEGRKVKSSAAETDLGDIIVSADTAARQAKEYGNTFWYEFCFYLCHGTLHLMGYDDKKASEAKRMDRKQKTILKKIGIK